MSSVNERTGYERIPKAKNNFPLKIRRYVSSSRLIPHWHEHLELIYVLAGEASFIVGGEGAEASRGDLVAIAGGDVHSFTVHTPSLEYLCVLIHPEFFGDVGFSGIRLQKCIRADGEVGACMLGMYEEEERGGKGSDMAKKALAYRLMAHLVREHEAEPMSERDISLRNVAHERLRLVLDAVANRYSEHLSTKDLADLCYLSEAHFCRFFKAATGKTPLEYLNEYRIERAAAMLSESSLPLSELAASVGISDANYFCRLFKRIKGTSPAKMRSGGEGWR